MTLTYNVNDTTKIPSHHIQLVAGSTTVGLILPEGSESIKQDPYQPSSLQFNQGRQGYGSFEPPYTSQDQVDWTGGLGQLHYKDASKFYDSYNMWSLTDDTLMPAPLWRHSLEDTNRNQNTYMPGSRVLVKGDTANAVDVEWQSLTSANRYMATQFTSRANYSVAYLWLYLRYFGSPGTLTAAIYTDSTDDPSSAVANGTVTLTNANISKASPEGAMVGQLVCFAFATAPSVSVDTKYHAVVYGAAGDNSTNYWEVGFSDTDATFGSSFRKSSDGSSWSASDGPIFHHLTAAVKDAEFHFTNYKGAVYACSEPADGTAGKVYLNGDRGVATGSSSATTLVDTTQSWAASNVWKNATVHIFNGTGEGQYRKIISNTATTLTVEPAWDITPIQGGTDTGSEYVIIGTPFWQDVTPTNSTYTITKPITDVFVLWGVMYCCQGEDANVAKLREYNDNSSPGVWFDFHGENANTHDTLVIADANFVAELMASVYDPVNENFVWRARNQNPAEWTGTNQTSVSKADDVVWSSNMSFGTGIPVGTRDYLITGLGVYNNKLWVGKEDSLWYIDHDGSYDRAYPVQIGLEAMSDPENLKTMIAKDLFLIFNWAHSVEKMYGSTLLDIGPWRGAGLVTRARGPLVDLIPVIGWMFGVVDAGPYGQSSLMAYNERGWHTLFRAPSRVKNAFSGDNANPRIRSMHWQSVPGKDSTNFLWFEMGGEIMFMRMPRSSLNPAQDENLDIAPESFVVQSMMDSGYAELEKHFEKGRHVSNKVSGTLYLDYDTNPDPFSFSWTNATQTANAPSYSYDISDSRKRNIMVRTRIQTTGINDSTNNNINAIILDAFARTPVKYNWIFPIVLDEYQKTIDGQIDLNLETKFTRLNDWATQAQELTMRAVFHWMDNKTVVIEPLPATFGGWTAKTGVTKANLAVTLRET